MGAPRRGGRLLARRLPPLALDWSASAGRRSSAALGLPRGRQAPPHALRASGLAPNPPSPRVPRLSCPVLSSPYLCRVPCPLGATLPFGAPSLCPWWWGEKDAWGAGRGPRWLRGEVGGGGGVRPYGWSFFLIKNLIKKFYTFYLFSSKTPHLLHRVLMERPPSQQDSHRFHRERAARCPPPFFSAWVATRFLNPHQVVGGAVCPVSGGRGGGPLASPGTSGRRSTSARPGPQASRAGSAEARRRPRGETRWWLT